MSPLRIADIAALAALLVAACQCAETPVPATPVAAAAPALAPAEPYVPRARCDVASAEVAALEVAPAGEWDRTLAAFDRAFDAGRFDEALACAQAAARLGPDEPLAHLDRALAMDALGLVAEAAGAYERALALDPGSPDTLRAVADFHLRRGSDDALESALVYARRGREAAEEVALAAELAALEAAVANALGRPAEALQASESALAFDEHQPEALVERAVALFELLRFDDAARAFERARARQPNDPRTAWHAALLAERLGDEARAARLFDEASRRDPEAFPPALRLAPAAFDQLVRKEVEALDASMRARLATVDFRWEELPAIEDLSAGDPPLSPVIVGLFRPEQDGAPAAIRLYRRNLLRLVRSTDELRREIRTTLLHELGHLAGDDDAQLRDRGL